jgi:MYXO-CTERM domain-containing protein
VPVVTTVDAMPRSGTTAQLDGTANPGGGDTTAWFRYDTTNPGFCDDSFGTRTPTNGGTDLGAGTSAESFSAMLTGLSPGTTYYACAIASNASGTSFGAVLSFTAPVPPTVLTTTATAISSTQATLNGSANPNGTATTGWLRYDLTSPGTCNDTFGTRVPATGGTSLGAGQAAAAFSQIVTGLSSTTTYYFCAIASSTGGVAVGTVLSFTTSAAPTVTTSAATQVTSSSATLNASAGANGSDTTGWFRYGTTSPGTCNDTFGTRLPSTGGTDLGSGFSATPYTQAVSGLTPGTTYYYCALASNSFGTGFGSVLSFTATAVAPTVTTSAATLITGSTAQLNGSANPGGADATGWFRYDTTSPGSCSDGFGTRVPATGGTDLGSGNTAVPFSEALTGLSAGTTYYFCALTSNSQGTSSGTVLSFTTEQPPTVTTSPATSVTAGTATLNGSANPNGVNATGWFRYDTTNPGSCGDTFGTRIPVTGGSNLGAGTTAAAYSQAVTGLNPGTTYYFCALASSSAGTSSGAVATFTTAAAPPTVMTDPATQVTVTTATLNGSATPNGGATTAWFRYSATNPHTCNDTFGTRTPATGGTALGAGLTAAAFSQDITGLLPTTTYYFCAIASNSAGAAVVGTLASFTTPAPNTPPAVTTVAATALTSSSATMNGTANPNLASTTGWFRFSPTNPGSCDDAFGTRVPATGGTQVGAGGSAAAFAETMTGLAPATTYYFCAIASNASGTSFGGVLSWTTLADAPIVTTTAPTGVHVDMATLNGSATPNGADTSGWFRYDTTSPGTCNDTFGTRVPATGGVDLGGGSTASPYSEMITGLVPGTSYFFCAIAANTVGTSYGSVLSFSPGALAPVVTTDAATAIMGTGATLAGTVNPNALDTTGWFRYGPTQPTTCDDSFGQRAPETGGIDIPAGTSPAGYTQAVTGLMPATTYYFCAAASNQGGATFGGVRSFTTAPALPQVVTGTPMLGGTAGSVTLSGMANPGGADAMGWFRYDTSNPGTCTDSFGTRVPATGGIDLGTGMSEKPFSDAVTGLSPGTYYVCALASNSSGTGVGGALSFVIPKPTPSGSTKSGGCACRAGTGASDSVLWLLPFVLLAIPRRRRSVP